MALSQTAIRRWYLVHKWTSIVATGFLLMLCITGLPLIFHHEIDELTRAPDMASVAPAQRAFSLDDMVRRAHAEVPPDWMTMFITWDDDNPLINVILVPSMKAGEGEAKILPFDARTGERLNAPPANEGVMYFILDLHASLLLGLPGTLFLGLIGLVFVVSIISGVVVYAPFMRRLAFGTVRKERSKRIKWLDTHNMTGIVTLGWVSVVGVTGLLLTLSTPIQMIWQMDQLAELAAPYKGQAPVRNPVPVDVALASVKAQVPDADISFISWPGSPFSTPHHYMVAMKGDTPLTERLVKGAMVDAETGKLTNVATPPWYVNMLFLSVPLHFGDYGGMPLKIIWALLDVAAIIVLATGLYLWLGRRTPVEKRVADIHAAHLAAAGQGRPEAAE